MPSDQKTIVDEISLSDLYDDPYPIYRRLRTEAPVAWVPVANRYLVTRYDDIVHLERHPEIFIANEHGSLMTRIMGHTLLRKDGAAHRRERAAAEAPMRPRTVNRHWMPLFQRNADDLIDEFAADGGATCSGSSPGRSRRATSRWCSACGTPATWTCSGGRRR
ncbi:hypothetical protein ACFQ1L_25215 [Phytohabitans flavus]|uniref:hypothetical protein n=1 Tax=Phytohabitans flavus TaxID=1076124 RepID=UPI00362FA810